MSKLAAQRASLIALVVAGAFYGITLQDGAGWRMALGASVLMGLAFGLAHALALESEHG
jgi:uncharacterized membrane protein